ncbi:glycosyltransferase family 39 protein [Rickettsiella endosymbiont of Dermanyssus gallinae]|uniref:glycosyltransferase family 39 protein n=1 Tax=Rickettsiella endosymbiont of Dermanyssus gallinae TaxID=2856608 RepID=UPI001C52C892|nr:glycosyltransferase family 39 protein [Rickettsiella endosymbiont of Dermanyssus gallinae]
MSMLQQQCKRGTWCFDLLALTAFIVLLFGLFLGSRPLSTPDEARYSEVPREMLVLHDFVTPHLNGVKYFEKPPLFYWVQAASIKLFHPDLDQQSHSQQLAKRDKILATKSISEWIVRVPNALIALLGCLLLYAAGRQLFDRQTGLISAVILASSFLYFTLARMVTLDMSLSVFLSGSLLAFLVAVNTLPGGRRRYIFYLAYSFAALAVLTKGLIGIVFPAMIVGSWILLTQQWRLLKQMFLPSGILLFLAIVLPWHILVQLKNPEFFQFYFIDQQFLRYSTLIAQRYQPVWFFVPIFLAGFLPWVVFLFQAIAASLPKTWQQIAEKRKQVFLLLWISIVFIFFSLSHSKLIPYILPIFPAVALLTGRYLVTHAQQAGVKWGTILLPCLWATLGVFSALWLWHHPAVDLPKPGIPFLVAGYSVFLLASLLAAFSYIRHRVKTAFVLLTLGSAISFIIFSTGIPRVDTRSIKPLVQILKPLLHSQDKIVSFGNYYQDLPFYLNQQVMTVNVEGELGFGMQHQNTSAWMLKEDKFWPLWGSDQRVFMLADKVLYQSFKNNKKSIYFVAATPQDVLLTNHPILKNSIGFAQEDKQ